MEAYLVSSASSPSTEEVVCCWRRASAARSLLLAPCVCCPDLSALFDFMLPAAEALLDPCPALLPPAEALLPLLFPPLLPPALLPEALLPRLAQIIGFAASARGAICDALPASVIFAWS
jgi:hypothetical protein